MKHGHILGAKVVLVLMVLLLMAGPVSGQAPVYPYEKEMVTVIGVFLGRQYLVPDSMLIAERLAEASRRELAAVSLGVYWMLEKNGSPMLKRHWLSSSRRQHHPNKKGCHILHDLSPLTTGKK